MLNWLHLYFTITVTVKELGKCGMFSIGMGWFWSGICLNWTLLVNAVVEFCLFYGHLRDYLYTDESYWIAVARSGLLISRICLWLCFGWWNGGTDGFDLCGMMAVTGRTPGDTCCLICAVILCPVMDVMNLFNVVSDKAHDGLHWPGGKWESRGNWCQGQ